MQEANFSIPGLKSETWGTRRFGLEIEKFDTDDKEILNFVLRRPYGAPGFCLAADPALKRWANIRCTSGADCAWNLLLGPLGRS